MKKLIRICAILITGSCCFLVILAGQATQIENYNPVNPSIDTWYAKGYSEEKFNTIKPGDDTVGIIKLIGRPISVYKGPEVSQYWFYTDDGKCTWMDFAWLGRELKIDKNGKVLEVIKIVHYD